MFPSAVGGLPLLALLVGFSWTQSYIYLLRRRVWSREEGEWRLQVENRRGQGRHTHTHTHEDGMDQLPPAGIHGTKNMPRNVTFLIRHSLI